MPSDKFKSYLQLHLIVFIWGFTAVLGALISLDALPLVWYRMLLAAAFILVYILYKKFPLKLSTKELLQLLIAGVVIAMHWFTFFRAIKVSNVSVTLACLSTGAFFASLLEPLLTGKKVVLYEVFFGLMVIAGLSIIFRVEAHYIEGILLALTSAFLSALFSIINSKFAKTHNPSVVSFYEIAGGVLFFSVLLAFSGGFNASFFQVSASDWLYLALLSSVCTAYAFIGSVQVMRFLSPYTVMLTINLEPIYGTILAVLVFDEKEKMSPQFYFGALIIIVTVIINGIIKNRQSE
ncbi:MAG: DMT family transporter [Bacteroidetes bacterium]|nr:DMT family transporter [Bacteroidota bacterium]